MAEKAEKAEKAETKSPQRCLFIFFLCDPHFLLFMSNEVYYSDNDDPTKILGYYWL